MVVVGEGGEMRSICIAGIIVCIAAAIARAGTVGAVDNFEDGTLLGWSGAADANIATGGPAGAGDHFLHASSGTFGIVPNMAINNTDSRWIGNWSASGATSLDVDLKIFNGPSLSMRAQLLGGSSGLSQI